MKTHVKNKSYVMALQDRKAHLDLSAERHEFVFSKPLLRRGTAIREAQFAVSKVVFIYKMSISLIEANIKISQCSRIN